MTNDDVRTPTAQLLREVARDREQGEKRIRRRDEQRAEAERRNGLTVSVEEGRAEEAEQDGCSYVSPRDGLRCDLPADGHGTHTLLRLCECGKPSGKISICVDCQSAKYDEFNNVRHPSGMVRSPTEGKINYLLVRDGPMLERWARHMTDAIPSKGKRNWMNAHTAEDLERFQEGASRHFEQWLRGETDEDHAAALFFNVEGCEYVRARLNEPT